MNIQKGKKMTDTDLILEELEIEEEGRYSMLPYNPKRLDMVKLYENLISYFWTSDAINRELAQDARQFAALPSYMRRTVRIIDARFRYSDGFVKDIQETILCRIKVKEACLVRSYICVNEGEHNITYSKISDAHSPLLSEQQEMVDSMKKVPIFAKIVAWTEKWLGSDNDIHRLDVETIRQLRRALPPSTTAEADRKLLAKIHQPRPPLGTVVFIMAITEAIGFAALFSYIFWLSDRGILPGLTKGNEYISRDESAHVSFSEMLLTKHIRSRPTQEEATRIIQEAVANESEFVRYLLPPISPEEMKEIESNGMSMAGMNATLMIEHVKFCADVLLKNCGYATIYGVKNPFLFAIKQSISSRSQDFFKGTPTEYSRSVGSGVDDDTPSWGSETPGA